MLLSKTAIIFALCGFIINSVSAIPAIQIQNVTTSAENQYLSQPSASGPSLGLSLSGRSLSKRAGWDPQDGAVLVRNTVTRIISIGFANLVQRWTLGASGGIRYTGLSTADLGAPALLNQAVSIALDSRNSIWLMTLPTTVAAQGRVAISYLTLALGPGMPSWERAFQFLDGTGAGNVAAGQNSLIRFVNQAVQTVLDNNLAEAVFEFTRIVDIDNVLPDGPQAVIMTLFAEIYHT